jgi:hypothetical protein
MDNKKNGVSGPTSFINSEVPYNADNILPEVLIISHPRSGTHLLESFLECHPLIHGRGEIFLTYQRNGIIEKNQGSKINVGDFNVRTNGGLFKKLGGILKNHKK